MGRQSGRIQSFCPHSTGEDLYDVDTTGQEPVGRPRILPPHVELTALPSWGTSLVLAGV